MPKNKPNGYTLFVHDWMKTNNEFRFEKAIDLAAGAWRSLPSEKKDYYKEAAKEAKRMIPVMISPTNNLTSSATVSEQKEDIYTPKARANLIQKWVLDCSVEELLKKDITVIQFNVSVVTSDERYYPIEIGMVRFSIKDGIKESYHRFIDSGKIEPGYTCEILSHMEKTHKIPLLDPSSRPVPEMAAVEKSADYLPALRELLSDIDKFVHGDPIVHDMKNLERRVQPIRPIFTFSDFKNAGLLQVQGCLKRLSLEAKDNCFFESFLVLDLAHAMYNMYIRSNRGSPPIAYHYRELEVELTATRLRRDCEFHHYNHSDFCALSRAYRLAYVCIDVIGGAFNVKPTNKHIAPECLPREVANDMEFPLSREDRVENDRRSRTGMPHLSNNPDW